MQEEVKKAAALHDAEAAQGKEREIERELEDVRRWAHCTQTEERNERTTQDEVSLQTEVPEQTLC